LLNDRAEFEYALFVIRKWRYERVSYPDGDSEDVWPGTGYDQAEKWSRARFEEDALPAIKMQFQAEHGAWEDGYKQWCRSLTITEAIVKARNSRSNTRLKRPVVEVSNGRKRYTIGPDSLTGMYTYAAAAGRPYTLGSQDHEQIAELPNGREIANEPSFDEARRLLAASADDVLRGLYRYDNPEPALADDKAFEAWKIAQSSQPEIVKDQRGWTSMLYTLSGSESIEISTEWSDGWPEVDVIAVLNRLGNVGWQVINVTEDKGLYPGADAASESGPTAARFLLARSRN
jgi:hypothetical protein